MVFQHRKEKVSKGILWEVFGEGLMHAIEVFNTRHPQTLGASQEGVERSGLEADLAALCGTETEPGKLQVSDKVCCGKTGEHVCLSRQGHSRDIRTYLSRRSVQSICAQVVSSTAYFVSLSWYLCAIIFGNTFLWIVNSRYWTSLKNVLL